MKIEEAGEYWNNEQHKPHQVKVLPPSAPWFFRDTPPFSNKDRPFFMRNDERLTKALEMLRVFHWAEQSESAFCKEAVQSPSQYREAIRRCLTVALSDRLEEYMVESQYSEIRREKVDVYQASVVFLPPQAAKYIADTLEQQERRIAELEKKV